MRALVASLAAVLLAACAGARPRAAQERPAGYAHPEPDPSCHRIVAGVPALSHVEQVTVRVTLSGPRAVVDVLAPELTPAEAADVRRAFAACVWRPGENGAATGTVTFDLSRP